MPIHVPGQRDKRGKKLGTKRSVVAILSLTAMVDLFTVLVVFLLQNYATTGEVLDIPEGVKLPDAREVKDLQPANVIIVSDEEISFNNDRVASYSEIKGQDDWEISGLRAKIEETIKKGEIDKQALGSKIKKAVQNINQGDKVEAEEIDPYRRVTIQADKQIDFLTLKKVMYTATESGIFEINFAVMKSPENKEAN